ncbi:sensor histidine kinase [Gracilibacillus salinarum]|uniref:GHKL domain-containing protein n=1 Tax=Gracilibacillus salinarum TaxID=2932255 RepID=A0ABY4GHV0_9BACI|nr:GHKL domain-containing protein [Gracilibacillus salinarum]UOQ83744.1 GHKL domain-containing protein [Gracilibacillus salinarum]
MVLSLFFFVIELTAMFFGLFYTLSLKLKLKTIMFGVIAVGLPAVSSYLYVAGCFGISYLLISLSLFFYIHTRKLRTLLDVAILAIISLIAENLSQIIHFSFFTDQQTPVVAGINSLFLVIIFTVCTYLYRLFIMKIWQMFSIATQILLFFVAWVTTTVIFFNLFISLHRNLYYPAIFNVLIETIYLLLMFVLFALLFRNIKKENTLKNKEIEREQMLQYMQELERINKDMQSFRHDYQNILLTMQGYMEHNDIKGLKNYFNNYIVKVENSTLRRNHLFHQLDKIKIIELKGFLSSKILLAQESSITIHVEVADQIKAIDMHIIDLIRLIGILLDNALEASLHLENRELNMAFIQKKDGSLLMVIENRIENENITIGQLFQAGYSTKGKARGNGLTTARRIINQWSNATMNTRIENQFFIHEIEIKAVNEQISVPYEKTLV